MISNYLIRLLYKFIYFSKQLTTKPMSVQLGINGFGRIGRLLFRAAVANPQKFRITAINDLNEIPYLIYLLKYDSVHGKWIF